MGVLVMMRRAPSALVLALLVTVPGALPGASAGSADQTCFLLHVVGPSNETLVEDPSKDCAEDDGGVAFDASVTMNRVRGMLRLAQTTIQANHGVDPVTHGLTLEAGGGMESREEPPEEGAPSPKAGPSLGAGLDPQRLTLFFNVSWAGGCSQVRGDYHLMMNGRDTLDKKHEVPLSDLCPAVEQDSAALALSALRAIVAAVAENVPSVEVPLEDALSQAPAEGPEPPVDADVHAGPDDPEDPSTAQETPTPEEGASLGGGMDAGADDAEADASAQGEVQTAGLEVGTEAEAFRPPPAPVEQEAQAREPAPTPEEPTYLDVNPDFPARTLPPPPRRETRPLALPETAPPAPAPEPRREGAPQVYTAALAAPPRDPLPAAAAAAATGAAILLFLGFALYQRIGRPKALDHPVRATLHAACLASGQGATARDLAEAAGVPVRAAEYHLRYLVKLRLLREDVVPGQARRFAPLTAVAPAAAPSLDAQIVDILRQRPGLSTRDMAEALGVGYGRLDRIMKELLCDGRVESRVDAGRRAYYPPAKREE